MDSDSNTKTLQAYEQHVQEYIDGTVQEVSGFLKEWLDSFLGQLPKSSCVLELGSAFGRDAKYIEKAGYKVERTDATKSFVELLQKDGYKAHVLNMVTDELGENLSGVWANAVLLHLNTDEFNQVIEKVFKSLKSGGIFGFSIKKGTGSEWSSVKLNAPRFFKYWQESELESKLADNHFDIVDMRTSLDDKWIHVIASK